MATRSWSCWTERRFVAKWTATATSAPCSTYSGGHIHPLNLAIGEADAIRLNGGRVYEQSPVTRIQHSTPAVVSTARGRSPPAM